MVTFKELPIIKQAAELVQRRQARSAFEKQARGITLSSAITKATLMRKPERATPSDIAVTKYQAGDQK